MNYSMFDEIDYFTNFKGNQKIPNFQNEFNNNLNTLEYIENNNLDLYTPYEGYIRGNLFKNMYDQYKNFQPGKIKINSEQEEMLLNIGQIAFAAHELNLLLDNYPNNQEALDLFNKYQRMTDEVIKNYERRYGPLNVSSMDMKTIPFKWENDKWPWEM